MKTRWLLALTAVFFLALCLFSPTTVNNSFVTASTNETSSSVTVTCELDSGLNSSSVAFGSLAANTANSSATTSGFPILVTVYAATNCAWDLQVNGSDLINGGNTLTVRNVTYADNASSAKTELNATFTSGAPAYGQWVNQADPAADVTRKVHFWVSVPSGQAAAAYSGTVYVRVNQAA